MKKLIIISFVSAACILAACGDKVKRTPGRVYMPDMFYSRAYETYSVTEEQKEQWEKQGMYYTGMPVPGTIKRGVDYTFRLPKDKAGDSTEYVASRQIKSPIAANDSSFLHEAERLYLVNCGICHGTALDGNGPLFKNGDGPFPAKPANLSGGDPKYVAMPDGEMFYSITYGKNMMGSYASQLNSTQRWEVIAYIRSKQALASKTSAAAAAGSTAGAASPATSSGAKKDSTGKK